MKDWCLATIDLGFQGSTRGILHFNLWFAVKVTVKFIDFLMNLGALLADILWGKVQKQ